MNRIILFVVALVLFGGVTGKCEKPETKKKKQLNHVIFKNGLDNISIIGSTKEDVRDLLGEPEKETKNSLVYHKKYGYHVSFSPDYKVYGYTIFSNKKVKTVKGIKLGDSLKKVVSKYGKYTKEEESPTYFSGTELNVLYHYKKFDLYKINYDGKICFFFDKDKRVKHIFIGMW